MLNTEMRLNHEIKVGLYSQERRETGRTAKRIDFSWTWKENMKKAREPVANEIKNARDDGLHNK